MRIRVGISLLAAGVVLVAGAVASSRWHVHGAVSRDPHWVGVTSGSGEFAFELNVGPPREAGHPDAGWDVNWHALDIPDFRWTILRHPRGRTLASTDEEYAGFATPVIALERFHGGLSIGCGLLTASELALIKRIEQTRVYRVTVAAAYVPIVPIALGGLMFASGRRAKRRAEAGACAACGYDLAGIAARCPECGMEHAGPSRHDDHDGADRDEDVQRD